MGLHCFCLTLLILASFDVDNDMTASMPEGATATTMRELQGGGVDSFVRILGIGIASIIAIHDRSCHITLTNVPVNPCLEGWTLRIKCNNEQAGIPFNTLFIHRHSMIRLCVSQNSPFQPCHASTTSRLWPTFTAVCTSWMCFVTLSQCSVL